MKRTTTLALLLFAAVYLAIGQTGPFRIQAASNKANHPDSFNLPFTEDWSSGSLETNNWTTGCENWTINYQEGNENPSVEFTWVPWFQDEYSCSLVSDIFNGDLLEVGQIVLDFDIRLDNRQATGNEKLLVEVFDGADWNTVAEFANNGNIDWQENSIDITDYALAQTFQIRFNATGQNSFRILSWFVDNISVYRTCEPPNNLSVGIVWNTYLDWVVELEWLAPESTIIDAFTWIHWDNGINHSGLGLTEGGDFSVAIRWDENQLNEYDGDTLHSIRFFIADSGFSEIVVKLWTGAEAEQLIYFDTATNLVFNSWNEVQIDTLILLDASLEYWVGYRILGQESGSLPVGIDNSQAHPQYGWMFSVDEIVWDDAGSLSENYNWNIQLKLVNKDDTISNCAGFNIYRRKVNDEPFYTLYGYETFIDNQLAYVFGDTNFDYIYDVVCYKLEAVWVNGNDTCASPFGKDIYEMEDNVCYVYEGINDKLLNNIRIFPNPTTNTLNITTKDGTAIKEIRIYNLTGQLVFRGEMENNSIDISRLHDGMYVVEVMIGQRKIRKKLMVK